MASINLLHLDTERIINPQHKRCVVVCFLDSRSSAIQEHWLNGAAERLAPPTINGAPPKIHCEILFPETDLSHDTGYSCSICYNGQVFLKPKRFSRDEWTFRVLGQIPAEIFNEMRSFCQGCVGDYFNHIGYVLYGMTSGMIRLTGSWTQAFKPMSRRWFCSEIVIETLKIGGYLPRHLSSVQHPETLFQLLQPQSSAGSAKPLNNLSVV